MPSWSVDELLSFFGMPQEIVVHDVEGGPAEDEIEDFGKIRADMERKIDARRGIDLGQKPFAGIVEIKPVVTLDILGGNGHEGANAAPKIVFASVFIPVGKIVLVETDPVASWEQQKGIDQYGQRANQRFVVPLGPKLSAPQSDMVVPSEQPQMDGARSDGGSAAFSNRQREHIGGIMASIGEIGAGTRAAATKCGQRRHGEKSADAIHHALHKIRAWPV